MRRWQSRPVYAFLIRRATDVVPALLAMTIVWLLSGMLPAPDLGWAWVLRWLLILGAALLAVLALRRFFRLALPLSALYRLDLAFPDAIPSRFKLARRINAQRTLEERVRRTKAGGRSQSVGAAATAILELLLSLDSHDRRTRGHAERVRVYTDVLAGEIGLSRADRDRLRWAALLHDVGKLTVDPNILNKSGTPSESEWAVLHSHPVAGDRLLGDALRAWMGPWADGVIQHHERWDGNGYPARLAGDQISLAARVIGVCDAYEVMTAPRSYKAAKSHADALAELKDLAGSQFDPEMVRAFMAIPLRRLRPGLVGILAAPLLRLISQIDPGPLRSWVPVSSQVRHASTAVAVISLAVAGATPGAIMDAAPVLPAVEERAAEESVTSMDRLEVTVAAGPEPSPSSAPRHPRPASFTVPPAWHTDAHPERDVVDDDVPPPSAAPAAGETHVASVATPPRSSATTPAPAARVEPPPAAVPQPAHETDVGAAPDPAADVSAPAPVSRPDPPPSADDGADPAEGDATSTAEEQPAQPGARDDGAPQDTVAPDDDAGERDDGDDDDDDRDDDRDDDD